MATYLTDYQLESMAENPIKYDDLFDFNDDGAIKKGIADINKLKKTYTDFFDTVINGQIGRLQVQLQELSAENEKLAASTKELSVAQKANQKTLLDNLKVAESNAQAAKQIKTAQNDVVKANKAVSDGVKTLTQQYLALKKQYDAAFQAGDVAKMKAVETEAKAVSAQIKLMNTALADTKVKFVAAAGSYDELNNKTKALIVSLKAMPGGLSNTSKEAKALSAEIYSNTQRLKDFDKGINQNFRNVGNYKSALEGLGGSIKSLALSYVSITALISLVSRIVTSNAEISDSLADVRRTAALTADEAENLSNQLKKIDTRTSLQGLLAIAVIGGQLGIAKDQLAGFTKAIDQLAVTLSGEIKGGAEEVAESLGKINGVFKVQEKEGTDVERSFNKTGSAILALGQAGLATGEFLQDFTLRVAGTANVAKISLPIILAYAATLEETGSSAEVAGSAFSRLVGNLAAKRAQFFSIAKIADATLTLKSFTDLINTDANAALQKFFAGLNAGGKDLTSFTDLINQIGLKGGPAKNAVIALAQNQALLNERIGESVDAYDKGTLSAEQFAIKNNTLAGSIDKLSNSFTKLTTSGKVADFFKGVIDYVTHAIDIFREFDKVTGAIKPTISLFRSSGEGKRAAANTINDSFANSQKELASVTDPFSQDPKVLTKNLGALNKAYSDAYHAYSVYFDSIKSGKVTESTDAGQTLADFKENAQNIEKVLQSVKQRYDVIIKSKKDDTQVNDEQTDSELNTTKAIREKIKALQDDALQHPDNKAKDIEQIKALKAQLRELAGQSVAGSKAAKDGFSVLEEQLDKLEKQLQDSLIAGKIKAGDFDNPLVRKVNAAKVAIAQFKAAYDKVLSGPGIPLPSSKLDTEPNIKGLDYVDKDTIKKFRDQDIENYLDMLDKQQLATKQFNIKVLADYQAGIISKDELDTQLLNSEIANQMISYGYQKNALKLELQGTKDGSKERIKVLDQIAALDEKHTNEEIANAKKVEAVRVAAIKNVFDSIKPNIAVLSEQLGSGVAAIFSKLTDDLQRFFTEGKQGFTTFADKFTAIGDIAGATASGITDAFKASSESQIASLEKARDRELTLAGDNAAAKDAINARYDKKVAEQKRKAAVADKLNAIFQIALNTAIGVANAASKVVTLPLVPFIIALGAIELALVASKPIPKFAKGTDHAPEGEAWVGEKGPELIIEDGKYRVSAGTATRTHLKEGAKVKTAEETQAIFDYAKMLNGQFDNQYLDSMLKGTEVVRQANSNASNDRIIQALNRSGLTEAQIERAMSKALGKKPTQQLVLDENGFNVYNIGRNYRIKQQQERMKMGGNG